MKAELEPKRKLFRLTDIELDEISLVDAGANEFARVVLAKRDPGGTTLLDALSERVDRLTTGVQAVGHRLESTERGAYDLPAAKIQGGFTMAEITSDGDFKITKNDPGFNLIVKCVSAADTGNFVGLTKESFEKALDTVAASYASESGLSHEAAYAAILASPTGCKLYQGHCSAPPTPKAAPVEKGENESPA